MTPRATDPGKHGAIRVLHVVNTGERRGAEMFAFDLIRALCDAPLMQQVAVLRGSPPLPLTYEALTRILPSNGRRVPALRMDVRTLRALRTLVAETGPDIVQAHGGEAFKYSILATRRHRARAMYRRIGLADPSITHGPRRAAHASLMKRADRVVAVAEAVRRETVEVFRVPRERVVTVPRGIDLRRLEPTRSRSQTRADLDVPEEAEVLLSLGAFHREKDPVAHVDVGARVLRVRPKAIYLIAGDGALWPEVESAIRTRGMDGRIRMLGNRADVGDLLHASDVVLLASRSEGMPGCLIEAGMCGLPVASYSIGGSPEVVSDGVTGFLVAPGDRQALAARVNVLLEEEGLRREMGEAARARCRASFDITPIAQTYLTMYEELCA